MLSLGRERIPSMEREGLLFSLSCISSSSIRVQEGGKLRGKAKKFIKIY